MSVIEMLYSMCFVSNHSSRPCLTINVNILAQLHVFHFT